jgi:RNA polymerase-binding transcription factor
LALKAKFRSEESQPNVGETVVNARYLERYKRLLLVKRDELSALRDESAGLVPPAGDSGGDLMDRASADAEAELQLCMHQSEPHLLRAIEDALARMRTGKFGICEACKRPISKARLEAVPWTRHCRDCKERSRA